MASLIKVLARCACGTVNFGCVKSLPDDNDNDDYDDYDGDDDDDEDRGGRWKVEDRKRVTVRGWKGLNWVSPPLLWWWWLWWWRWWWQRTSDRAWVERVAWPQSHLHHDDDDLISQWWWWWWMNDLRLTKSSWTQAKQLDFRLLRVTCNAKWARAR